MAVKCGQREISEFAGKKNNGRENKMLLVCSKSTRKYFPDIEDVKIISSAFKEEDVLETRIRTT